MTTKHGQKDVSAMERREEAPLADREVRGQRRRILRRMSLGVCVVAIASLVLASGCGKPNLRMKGNTVLFTPVGPDFGVKLKIVNVGKRDAKDAFRVGFRRKTPPSTTWKFVPFAHGLAKGQEREIKVKMNVNLEGSHKT